jgi:hypothetical protein
MADEINREFRSYRELLTTEVEKQAFDNLITELLEKHGVDYVRGYVDALRDVINRTNH